MLQLFATAAKDSLESFLKIGMLESIDDRIHCAVSQHNHVAIEGRQTATRYDEVNARCCITDDEKACYRENILGDLDLLLVDGLDHGCTRILGY